MWRPIGGQRPLSPDRLQIAEKGPCAASRLDQSSDRYWFDRWTGSVDTVVPAVPRISPMVPRIIARTMTYWDFQSRSATIAISIREALSR
jgi:hypothetical protein